jgi:hypothetical protein
MGAVWANPLVLAIGSEKGSDNLNTPERKDCFRGGNLIMTVEE